MVPTWSRLGPDLVPTWSRLSPDLSGRPSDRGDKTISKRKLWFGKSSVSALPNHVASTGAHALDILGQVERFGEQGIAGDGTMGMAEFVEGERGREGAGVPDFEAVGKQHDLNAAVAVVITVSNGVDDGLGHYFARNFVFDRGLRAMFAGADAEVDFGHHKINRLVDQFKGGAFINLMGRNRFGNLGAVEVGAFDFGGCVKRCGYLPKSKMAALVGAPSSSRFRWVSTSPISDSAGAENCAPCGHGGQNG